MWLTPLSVPPEDPGLPDHVPEPEDDPGWPGADEPCEDCGQRYCWDMWRGVWLCMCDEEDTQ